VLTVKQSLKLTDTFVNDDLATKLARDYGIGIQTIPEIKKNGMKFMEFVKHCDSGAGPSNHKSIRKSSYDEVDVALLQWFNQKQA
jgi:hypothetical protein